MPKTYLTEDQAIMAAHMAATTAAFQVLVKCLEESGALERNQFSDMLMVYIKGVRAKGGDNDMMLSLLHDLIVSLKH